MFKERILLHFLLADFLASSLFITQYNFLLVCEDVEPWCSTWKEQGYCDVAGPTRDDLCRLTCGTCGKYILLHSVKVKKQVLRNFAHLTNLQ